MLKKLMAITLSACMVASAFCVYAQDPAGPVKAEVIQKSATGLTFTDKSFPYDGNEKELLVEGTIPEGVVVTYQNNKAKDAGTYAATAKITKDGKTETLSATMQIAQKTITITGMTAEDKRYDGTNRATFTGGAAEGIIEGDDVTVAMPATGIFAQEEIGADISATPDEFVLSGEKKMNYNVAKPEDLKATIRPADITVTAQSPVKGKGDQDPELKWNLTDGQLYGTDALSGTLSRAPGEEAGEYDILQGSLAAPANYQLTYVPGKLTIVDKTVQKLNFYAIPEKTYGDADFKLLVDPDEHAQLSEFTYTSSNPEVAAVEADGTVKILGAGQTEITVNQAGNSYYAPASETKTLTVLKKALRFSMPETTLNYGDPISLPISGDGFISEADRNAITPTVKASGYKKAVGSYDVKLSGAESANYEISYADSKLTIAPKTLTITALSVFSKAADGTQNAVLNPSSFRADGIVSGDDVRIDTEKTTAQFASADAGDNIPVTISNITLTGADAGNYLLASDTFQTAASIKAELKAADVAAQLSAPLVVKNTRQLALPSVPEGFTVSLKSSDKPEILKIDGTIVPVGENTEVSVVFEVKSAANAEDIAETAAMTIVIPESDRVKITATAENGKIYGVGDYVWGNEVTLTAVPVNKYQLEGWYQDGTRLSTNSTYSFTATEDTDLEAKFEIRKTGGILAGPVEFQVAFITNGGSRIEPVMVPRNSTVKEPAQPTKAGYHFAGWYADSGFKTKYDFDTKVTTSYSIYAKWEKNEGYSMILTIGNTNAIINGSSVKNDVAPIIRDDRTFTPSRFVAEQLGAKVAWDAADRIVTITSGSTTIKLIIGSNVAYVNDKSYEMDTAAFIENDRTYTPARFVAEKLGASVTWDEDNRRVTITK